MVDARLTALSEMSNGISGSRADPAAGLRAHRVAPDQAGRDAGASVRRPLRLLRRAGEVQKPQPRLEPGSPFGQSIAAFVVYLHYAHAIGMERLSTLMDEIFSLSISEGAISNILARTRDPAAGRGSNDPRDSARQSGGVLRRDLGAGKRQELVGMGVVGTLAVLRDPSQPRQGRGSGAVRRDQADGLGLRHAGQPARPWCRVAGVPGASVARCEICDRMWRHCLQAPRSSGCAAAARNRYRTTP